MVGGWLEGDWRRIGGGLEVRESSFLVMSIFFVLKNSRFFSPKWRKNDFEAREGCSWLRRTFFFRQDYVFFVKIMFL